MEENNQPIKYEPKIIFSMEFDEEEIQSFAEANFGRELTEVELKRMQYWYEDDDVSWKRIELLASIIRLVTDPKEDWSGIDDYQPNQTKI